MEQLHLENHAMIKITHWKYDNTIYGHVMFTSWKPSYMKLVNEITRGRWRSTGITISWDLLEESITSLNIKETRTSPQIYKSMHVVLVITCQSTFWPP